MLARKSRPAAHRLAAGGGGGRGGGDSLSPHRRARFGRHIHARTPCDPAPRKGRRPTPEEPSRGQRPRMPIAGAETALESRRALRGHTCRPERRRPLPAPFRALETPLPHRSAFARFCFRLLSFPRYSLACLDPGGCGHLV